MYFILVNSRKALNYKWLGISVIFGAMIIASVGIAEFGAGKNLIGVADYLEEDGSTGSTTGLYRTNGPFYDSISYATLLVPYLAYVYYWRQKKMIGAITSFFATAVIATGSFVNFSRAAILGIFITLATCYAKNARLTLAIIFVLAIILAIISPMLSDFYKDFTSSAAFQERTSSGTMEHRWTLYKYNLDLVSENILIGIGYDNYVKLHGGATHNSYLQILIEEGIVGFCLFMIFIWNLCVQGLIKSLKMRDRLLTGVYVGISFSILFIGNTINLLQSQNFFFAVFIVLGSIHAYELNKKTSNIKK
jgi:O-antigen ligase